MNTLAGIRVLAVVVAAIIASVVAAPNPGVACGNRRAIDIEDNGGTDGMENRPRESLSAH